MRRRVGVRLKLLAGLVVALAAFPAVAHAAAPQLQVGVGRADLTPPTDFDLAGKVDPQLYAFMVRQLALAIRRANANLGPGEVGWGTTHIDDLTENRSIEAHLYDHGIHLAYGQGNASMDPLGVLHTIDPNVNVLRVDKVIGGKDVPVGMWS